MGEANKKLKVALVHDHLSTFGGAERVLYALHNMFPSAPIYTLFYNNDVVNAYFPDAKVKASFLQKFPKLLRRRFKWIAPLAISAVENFNFSEYDIVISSSAFFAKGVVVGHDTIHISYCHTPTRYLWENNKKEEKLFKRIVDMIGTHLLRIWDFSSAGRVDYFVANSKYTKKRIEKYYKKDAFVVYPPVDIDFIKNGELTSSLNKKAILDKLPQKFFLMVTQLQEYKQVKLVTETFSKLKYPLVIIGDGPLKKELKKIAPQNVFILGKQPDDIVKYCYKNCYAYIHAAEDDFGISPVEAMQFGKPVLAYAAGGALETMVGSVNGEFFGAHHPAILADGLRRLMLNYPDYNDVVIKNLGNRFKKERFQEEFRRILKRILVHELNGESKKLEIFNSLQVQQPLFDQFVIDSNSSLHEAHNKS